MEGFTSDMWLTTSQVADLLDVHPSTVKRWCNDGELELDRTGGGHRRIHLGDALTLARSRGIETFLEGYGPEEDAVWSAMRRILDEGTYAGFHELALTWLEGGETGRLGRLVYEVGRQPAVTFDRFCDEGVRGLMALVGEGWRSGRFCAGEEHMASEAVMEALLRLGRLGEPALASPGDQRRPAALVGAMEGDRHRLGALCVRLLLERRGWRVYYLGSDVPVEDFAALQRSRTTELVCVSFTPPHTAADMRRCVRLLAGLYDPLRPYALALGGDIGEVSDLGGLALPFRELDVHDRLSSFRATLDRGFGRATQGRA